MHYARISHLLEVTFKVKSIMRFLAAFGVLLAIAMASPTKEDCFINDFAYGGEDILVAGFHNIKNDAVECQASCQVINLQVN